MVSHNVEINRFNEHANQYDVLYPITTIENVVGLRSELDTLKTSVSDGKRAVASAITDKGVSTSATDPFATMASNISKISSGSAPNGTAWTKTDVTVGKKIYSDGDTCLSFYSTNDASYVVYSSDKITWHVEPIPVKLDEIHPAILYADGRWVAYSVGIGSRSAGMYYSIDGIEWEYSHSQAVPFIDSIAYANGVFVVASSVSDKEIWYSDTRGVTWTKATLAPTAGLHYQVVAAGGVFLAVPTSTKGDMMYSHNGVTWTAPNGDYHAVNFANTSYDIFFKYKSELHLYTLGTSDGLRTTYSRDAHHAWELDLNARNKIADSMIYGDSEIVKVQEKMLYSRTFGSSTLYGWQQKALLPALGDFVKLYYANKVYICVMTNALIAYYDDFKGRKVINKFSGLEDFGDVVESNGIWLATERSKANSSMFTLLTSATWEPPSTPAAAPILETAIPAPVAPEEAPEGVPEPLRPFQESVATPTVNPVPEEDITDTKGSVESVPDNAEVIPDVVAPEVSEETPEPENITP